MFIDLRKIKLKAGNGGNGNVSFSTAYGGKAKPYGGIGGRGGNVYLIGSSAQYDLAHLKNDYLYAAQDGVSGGQNNRTGADGKDIELRVPLTTKVYDENGNLVAAISNDGQKELILKGGKGGLGNYFFRKSGLEALYKSTRGAETEEELFKVELELQSEIIFIGFPNAGKSSIINEITNAKSKVASYAFTTIDPVIGQMNSITLLDLPGLIEGTFEGKGLGTRFVKHTRSSKIVAHFVSIIETDVVETYKRMRKELEQIGHDLDSKDEIIILTKSDMLEPSERTNKKIEMENYLKSIGENKKVLVVSIYDLDALEELKKSFTDIIKQQD